MAIITAVRQSYKGIQDQFTNTPWLSIFPGLAIFFSVFSFNLIADGLRDISDPKLRG
jgi:ABC-type dipeptide/oligopeptide/nickel transport system permease subunit